MHFFSPPYFSKKKKRKNWQCETKKNRCQHHLFSLQCLYFYPRPERFRKCSPSIPSFILSPVLLLRLPIFFKTELVSCHRVLPFIQHCSANLVPFMDEQKSHSIHLNYFKTELALTCQNKNNLSVFIMHQFLAVKCSVRYVPEHELFFVVVVVVVVVVFV